MSGAHRKFFRRKWALIIGNGEYSRPANKLNNSVANANNLVQTLKKSNFKFTKCDNINVDIMEQVRQFNTNIQDGDLIVFYFSGHARHFDGHNYLLPTDDSRVDSGEDIRDLGTNVRRIVERLLHDKPSCIAVVILDCCKPYVLGSSTEPNRK